MADRTTVEWKGNIKCDTILTVTGTLNYSCHLCWCHHRFPTLWYQYFWNGNMFPSYTLGSLCAILFCCVNVSAASLCLCWSQGFEFLLWYLDPPTDTCHLTLRNLTTVSYAFYYLWKFCFMAVKNTLVTTTLYEQFFLLYDLKLSWWQDSIKSSRAISRVRWIKETDFSKTVSVFIIRDVMMKV
jgi:hypothetical protein